MTFQRRIFLREKRLFEHSPCKRGPLTWEGVRIMDQGT